MVGNYLKLMVNVRQIVGMECYWVGNNVMMVIYKIMMDVHLYVKYKDVIKVVYVMDTTRHG
jgi:hypothetical protein